MFISSLFVLFISLSFGLWCFLGLICMLWLLCLGSVWVVAVLVFGFNVICVCLGGLCLVV